MSDRDTVRIVTDHLRLRNLHPDVLTAPRVNDYPLWREEFLKILENPLRLKSYQHLITEKGEKSELHKYVEFTVDASYARVFHYLNRFFQEVLRPLGWTEIKIKNGLTCTNVTIVAATKEPKSEANGEDG